MLALEPTRNLAFRNSRSAGGLWLALLENPHLVTFPKSSFFPALIDLRPIDQE
jgi:hypothetical protein